jgi:hypothetical protein
MKIELGQKVKDKITGFTGVVTGRTEYITGCEQLLVQPPTKNDGAFTEPRWFDVDRLDVIEQEKVSLTVKKAGFDSPAPAR